MAAVAEAPVPPAPVVCATKRCRCGSRTYYPQPDLFSDRVTLVCVDCGEALPETES